MTSLEFIIVDCQAKMYCCGRFSVWVTIGVLILAQNDVTADANQMDDVRGYLHSMGPLKKSEGKCSINK